MKKVVIGYAINDDKVFNTSVLGEALKRMTVVDKYDSESEKLEAIREVLKRG